MKGTAGYAHVTRGHSTIRTDYEKIAAIGFGSLEQKENKSPPDTKHYIQPT